MYAQISVPFFTLTCFEMGTVFQEHNLRKGCGLHGKLKSEDKYPGIFVRSNRGYCVWYSSNIFHNMQELKAGAYHL